MGKFDELGEEIEGNSDLVLGGGISFAEAMEVADLLIEEGKKYSFTFAEWVSSFSDNEGVQ